MGELDKQLDTFLRKKPKLGKQVYLASTAVVIGDVTLGAHSSVWYGAVLRGDINRIVVGHHTNVQDNAVLHLADKFACVLGNWVTVGHSAVVHNRWMYVFGGTGDTEKGRALEDAEVAHRGCTELHVVETMHERKAAFTSLSDGFLTLPGGVGTMDELWEAVSWAQLGYHAKPVGLLNAFGFYDQLLSFNAHMAEVGFIRPIHRGIIIAEHELGLLLERMAAHEPAMPLLAMDLRGI